MKTRSFTRLNAASILWLGARVEAVMAPVTDHTEAGANSNPSANGCQSEARCFRLIPPLSSAPQYLRKAPRRAALQPGARNTRSLDHLLQARCPSQHQQEPLTFLRSQVFIHVQVCHPRAACHSLLAGALIVCSQPKPLPETVVLRERGRGGRAPPQPPGWRLQPPFTAAALSHSCFSMRRKQI